MTITPPTLEQIEQQIGTSFEFYEAMKPENQKIFPFYVLQNFRASNGYPDIPEPLSCSYCGEKLCKDYGYYMAYVVFEAADKICLCCEDKKCLPFPNILSYHKQIYGFKDPVVMPEEFKSSLIHSLVSWCFFGGSDQSTWYKLNRYVKKGLTMEGFRKHFDTSFCGGSHNWYDNGVIKQCMWQYKDKKLATWRGEAISLTHTDIVKIINEILEANRTEHKQLALF